MDASYTDNVLAEIEEDFQDIVKDNGASKLDETDLLDEAIEEFDVVDSWEVGGVDDIHAADVSYGKSGRRSRGSSYTRRKEDKFSRRDVSYDNYRNRKIPYRRHRSRSHSKPSDHHLSPRSTDRKTNDRHSLEHLRESQSHQNSSRKNEKLPDLKCTTSIETGEINVVLLTEEKGAFNAHDEKEKLSGDGVQRKPPTLLKNPFAYARLKRQVSESPERIRVRESEASPRHSIERHRRESKDSRSFDSRNKDRSISPYRPKSNRRASPYFYDKRSRRRSISHSPERYQKRRMYYDHRRSRESSRWHSRSREGSVLSRVSSKSSLSFISARGRSPKEHDRKQSPLRPFTFYNPTSRPNNEKYMSNSEDFNHKLSILLKEGKQKQSSLINDSGPTPSSSYPSDAWKPTDNWGSPGGNAYPPSQEPVGNYTEDAITKPNYNANSHQNEYPGFSQGQYNQAYYNNNQPQNYPDTYTGNVDTAVQPPYSYGNQYSNQIHNQYYPQTTAAAINFPSTPYAEHPNMGQYQPMGQPQSLPVTESMAQPPMNLTQQPYNMNSDQLNYMGMNSQPVINMQTNTLPESCQNEHVAQTSEWSKYNNKRVPTRTSIPLTSKENDMDEADPMRTPPPPVISDTWREIESGGKNLSSLLEEANKKREVISRCEGMLQKLLANDPSMERFKVTQCDNLIQFSVKEESKPTSNLISRNAVRTARRLAKTLRYQSPLLRRRNNPRLKFTPWMPEDEVIHVASERENSGNSVPSSVKPTKSILKNPLPGREEVCSSCVMRREGGVSISTQTDEPVTNEVGVQVECNWHQDGTYYSNSHYNSSNEQSYPVWYRR